MIGAHIIYYGSGGGMTNGGRNLCAAFSCQKFIARRCDIA